MNNDTKLGLHFPKSWYKFMFFIFPFKILQHMEIHKAKQAPSTTLYIYMVSTQEVRCEMRYGWNRNSPLV